MSCDHQDSECHWVDCERIAGTRFVLVKWCWRCSDPVTRLGPKCWGGMPPGWFLRRPRDLSVRPAEGG